FCTLMVLAYVAVVARADEPIAGRLLVPLVGDRVAATLVSISDSGGILFHVDRNDRRLRPDEFVAWGSPAEPRTDRQLVLADGGIIPVRLNPLPVIEQEQLIAVSDTFGELKLPLKSLAGIILHAPIDPQRRDELTARLRAAQGAAGSKSNNDRLLLENGDELRGRIVALNETAVDFEADLGALKVEIERVAALAFNPSLRAAPKTEGARLLVGFADGCIFAAESVRLNEGRSEIELVGGGSTLSAGEEPIFLQPLGGAVKYLSDLPIASYRHLPYLDLPYEYRLDANVDGTRLRAAGNIYPKGVGMHSAARLTWELKRTYRRFEAGLAIDDQTGGRGSVVFRVFSGSREIYKSPIVRGGARPLPVSVDIRDARQLSLVVDYADRADVLDHADWLNARLVP
ncbi:MAG: NPCBM/NEW2 domain-containing protein, partial [Pirellulales bacterium]